MANNDFMKDMELFTNSRSLEFFNDLRQWLVVVPDSEKVLSMYERGLITMDEALKSLYGLERKAWMEAGEENRKVDQEAADELRQMPPADENLHEYVCYTGEGDTISPNGEDVDNLVLKRAAELLSDCLPDGDLASRWDGDELSDPWFY